MDTWPEPQDAANRAWLEAVRPVSWRNPAPRGGYDLVVLGAGTAGLVCAAGAAGLGARVALVERHRMGGDCLNTGCVPSKSLLRAAHLASEVRGAGAFGILSGSVAVDFGAVMERVRRVRAAMAPHDGVERFARLGVDVFLGHGSFADARTVVVGGARLRFRSAVVATGARPFLPDVPGLRESGALTPETVFNLTSRPARMVVLGGGPVGCELAQAFARLGVDVILLQRGPRLLPREDPEASAVLEQALRADGVGVRLGAVLRRVMPTDAGQALLVETGSGLETVETDVILVGAGRSPNVEGLGLEAAAVRHDAREGVVVDDFLRTSNPRVYACGDVCLRWKFTHAADAAARIVIQNALFSLGPIGRRRMSALVMPWCTYTDPEVARVGMLEWEAVARGMRVEAHTVRFEEVDRARTDGNEGGFVRVHTVAGSDRIVGATVVGSGAGDLISEVSVAMAGGVGLGRLAGVIHPYPTLAEALRRAGDLYRRGRLTPRVKAVMARWLAWRR